MDELTLSDPEQIGLRLEELQDLHLDAKKRIIQLARSSSAIMSHHVLRHEQTSEPVTLTDTQLEWHQLMDESKRLLVWSHIEAGKTQHFSIARPLWEIGNNPGVRCVILASAASLSKKIVTTVKRYIESSMEFHEVFPEVRPGLPWTNDHFNVFRKQYSKDYTLQATGIGGKVLGSRIDRLFLDDVLDLENTSTTDRMQFLIKTYLSEYVGRLTAKAKVLAVGNAYNPHDLYHYLKKKSGYTNRTYPVTLPNGEPRFPAEWSKARIAEKRLELGPEEGARQLDCVPRDSAASRCPQPWLDAALLRGLGVSLHYNRISIPDFDPDRGDLIVSSMDIGIKRNKKSGKTAFFTSLYRGGVKGDRQLLDLTSGRFTAREMLDMLRSIHLRYGSVIFVEDNAAQDLLVQLAQEEDDLSDLAVRPFNTGGNKADPVYGVESVFSEFSQSRWIIPSVMSKEGPMTPANDAIAEWMSECFFYNPANHTGDHLMSAWINREGWRKLTGFGYGTREVGVTIAGDNASDVPSVDAEQRAVIDEERKAELEGWEAAIRKR